MDLGIRNQYEQHCPVCEQLLSDDQRAIEANQLLFIGAAAYAWCPECRRQVRGDWDLAYKLRWAEAFSRFAAQLRAKTIQPLWRLVSGTGAVVELTLAPTESGYALRYIQDGQERTIERFERRESALFSSDELRQRLLDQGFARPDKITPMSGGPQCH
jgi:hypothetical protein